MMLKRIISILLVCVFLAGCANRVDDGSPRYTRFSYEFFDVFDTYVSITAFAESEDDFYQFRQFVYNRMNELHRVYSIFNDYDGVTNIKTINDNAGEAVVVCADIIDLLEFAVRWHGNTSGAFNIALGPVTRVWREYRERYQFVPDGQTSLPDIEYLESLRHLTNINNILINRAESTVKLAYPGMSIDVGSVAKGFAVQRVVTEAHLLGLPVNSFLIDAGRHIRVFGTHPERANGVWRVDALNPFDPENPLATFNITSATSVDTSGSYQRYFMYDGRVMGHVISPFTLMPADEFTSVTVVARNSAAADILSTAMKILSHQAGISLAELHATNVVWLLPNGQTRYFPFF